MGSTAAGGVRRGVSGAATRARAGAIALIAVAALAAATVANAAHVAPTYVAGNPSCAGMLKLEPVATGTFGASFDGEAGSIAISVRQTSAGPVLDFSTDRASHVVEL